MATEGASLTGLSAYGNGKHGHHWALSNKGINKNNFLTSLVGDTSGDDNILIEDLWDTKLLTCWGSDNLSRTENPNAVGFRIRGSRAKSLRFIGGSAVNNNGDGILVELEPDTGAPNYAYPSDIYIEALDLGSTAAGTNGNGRAGAGYGLHLGPGLPKDTVTLSNCKFSGNVSGRILNESAAAALVVDDWIDSFVPDISSTENSITTKSAECHYRRDGDIVHISMTIEIPANGDGSGEIVATLPIPSSTIGYHIFHGYEAAVTGQFLTAILNPGSSSINIRSINGYPGLDGAVLVVNGWYRI